MLNADWTSLSDSNFSTKAVNLSTRSTRSARPGCSLLGFLADISTTYQFTTRCKTKTTPLPPTLQDRPSADRKNKHLIVKLTQTISSTQGKTTVFKVVERNRNFHNILAHRPGGARIPGGYPEIMTSGSKVKRIIPRDRPHDGCRSCSMDSSCMLTLSSRGAGSPRPPAMNPNSRRVPAGCIPPIDGREVQRPCPSPA